jgi:hypothetical protein
MGIGTNPKKKRQYPIYEKESLDGSKAKYSLYLPSADSEFLRGAGHDIRDSGHQ